MAEEKPIEESSKESFWRPIFGPVIEAFQRNECFHKSYELGIECCLATYLITAFAIKKPERAFKYSMIAFFAAPTINWPFCVQQKWKRKAELEPREM